MSAFFHREKANRHIIHCLLCGKPQDIITTHLARVCMKTKTFEQRNAEVQRAKESMKTWNRQGRNWDYDDICTWMPHRQSQMALLQKLQARGFFVANAPNIADHVHLQDQPSAVAASADDPALQDETTALAAGEYPSFQDQTSAVTAPADDPSQASGSQQITDQGDPTWQK